MDTYESFRASLTSAFSLLGARLAEYAPKLLGAALLLLVGWLIARLLRGLAVKLMHVFELLLRRLWRGHSCLPRRDSSRRPVSLRHHRASPQNRTRHSRNTRAASSPQ